MTEPIPTWLLERYALGELPPEKMASLKLALAQDPVATEQLSALRTSDQQILADYPPAEVDRRVRARAQTARSRIGFVLPVLAVAGLLWLAILPPTTIAPTHEPEITRIKGVPALEIHRRRGENVERLGDGSTAAAGDLVELAYVAAGQRYGAIVSIDGRGGVTQHFPAGGSRAAELERGGAVPLTTSFELDDAPKFERFFLVTSPDVFELQDVLAAAKAVASGPNAETAKLSLSGKLSETTFVLRKEIP